VGGVSAADKDVVVHLSRPDELLSVDPTALLHGEARSVPGVVELVDDLLGRSRVGRRATIVLTLPADQIAAGTADQLQAALERYCRGRIANAEREAQVLWRQGLRSLRSGSILFIVGLLLSTGFLEPDVDSFWQNLLGNGVFLVIAWVGLWYPLDLLFFARQPVRREIQILRVLRESPVEVRASS
jgi:hypothetical protein